MLIRTDRRRWLTDYYRHVDAREPDGFMAMLTDDAVMTFANAEPVKGNDAIRVVLVGLLDAIAGIRHEVHAVYEPGGDLVVFECDVHYLRLDGRQVTVRGAGFFEIGSDDLCREQRILVDVSPVFT